MVSTFSYLYGTNDIFNDNFARQFQRISEFETDPQRACSAMFGAKACDNLNNYVQHCLNYKVISEGWAGGYETGGDQVHTIVAVWPMIEKPIDFRRFRMWATTEVTTAGDGYLRLWCFDKMLTPAEGFANWDTLTTGASDVIDITKWKNLGKEDVNFSYAEITITGAAAAARQHATANFPPNMTDCYFVLTYKNDNSDDDFWIWDLSAQVYFD